MKYFSDNGKEILSMNEVMLYLLNNSQPLIDEDKLEELHNMSQFNWQNFADGVKGTVFHLLYISVIIQLIK